MHFTSSTTGFLTFASLAFHPANAAPPSSQHVLGPSWAEQPALSHQSSAQKARWPLDMLSAIDVMQEEYFSIWQGTWPNAIDWTAAVLGTHVPATLSAISAIDFPGGNGGPDGVSGQHVRDDLVNTYFSQAIAFHYGQDWLALRGQANDDMLWVVLGWLEAITFIEAHSQTRHPGETYPWYGEKFLPAFAHRARTFWELASNGWDESLCGGGMVWNPRLAPYKNAITNQLYIAASISMYNYFPGDDNEAPFEQEGKKMRTGGYKRKGNDHKYPARDKRYLKAAIKAYDWLMASNMTNKNGLFVDGFHITGWKGGNRPSNGTGRCDLRDEQVYTYNQGVILTGYRGLWQATGDVKYLDEGHKLIQNVISATGWDFSASKAKSSLSWQGLGRLGVLEERCDILGTCSQDGQTFKGIFFLHYASFCKPLSEDQGDEPSISPIAKMHLRKCRTYAPWVEHNAMAALLTKDNQGRFGMWWTQSLWKGPDVSTLQKADVYGPHEDVGTDYRNEGVPDDDVWRIEGREEGNYKRSFMKQEMWRQLSLADKHNASNNPLHRIRSPEIQSGGLSVVRARTWHELYEDLM